MLLKINKNKSLALLWITLCSACVTTSGPEVSVTPYPTTYQSYQNSLIDDVLNWENVLPGGRTFVSAGHGNETVRVYFNQIAAATYHKFEGQEFKPGAITVKAFVTREEIPSLQAKLIYFMRKENPGYDSENGDWSYAVAKRQENGKYKFTHQGIIKTCIPCHKAYHHYDYVRTIKVYNEYKGLWGEVKLWLGL